jgi:hypothetical protein
MIKRCLNVHFFWVCLWHCFCKRLESESVDWIKKIHLCGVAGNHTICQGLNKTKRQRNRKFFFFLELFYLSFPALGCWSSWFSGFWTPGLTLAHTHTHTHTHTLRHAHTHSDMHTHTQTLLSSQAFRFRLNHTWWFSCLFSLQMVY